MIRSVLERITLEKMLVVPASVPPLRQQPKASFADRLSMVRLAVADIPGAEADNRESLRSGRSYTLDTIKSIHHDYPGYAVVMIIGRDSFDSLPKWHSWKELFDWTHIAVVTRPGYDTTRAPDWLPDRARMLDQPDPRIRSGGIFFIDVEPSHVSATDIRHRIKNTQPIDHLVPADVDRFIHHRKLYV